MGIVNVTPDSFSDGGSYFDPDRRDRARAGAGRRRRRGDRRRRRVDPSGRRSGRRRRGAPPGAAGGARRWPSGRRSRSASTPRRPRVASAAIDAGAVMVNDVSGGDADPDMLRVVADAGAAYVVDAHARDARARCSEAANYADVVGEVCDELRARVDRARSRPASTPRAILADPGIGFAKTAEHNLALLRALPEIAARVGAPARRRRVAQVVPRPHRRRRRRAAGRDDATLGDHRVVFRTGRRARARARRRRIAARGRAARDHGTRPDGLPKGLAA